VLFWFLFKAAWRHRAFQAVQHRGPRTLGNHSFRLGMTLLSLDIPIYFEKENINTGSMESELFLSILSSMAEGESASISENNKWSIKKRFLDGTS